MAAALNALFDKRRLSLTRARLRAWWEGEEFDEAAATAAIEAESLATGEADAELFDEPPFDTPPRLVALTRLWGENRLRPGDDTADALEPARLGVEPGGVLAMFSPGLVGPVAAIAAAHPGKIEVFEWREESIEALRYGVRKGGLAARVNVTKIDLEAHVLPLASFDGLWSVDDFVYASYPPHLAQKIFKSLKPGACAVIETYAGLPSESLASAFASSFAEPHVRAHGDLLQFFTDTGLALESDEDLTEEFLDLARQGFKRLESVLGEASSFDAATARELAWEAEAWRVRLRLLAQRRLERRRFIVRRPVDGPAPVVQAENTNAPAG
jgi:SAM-dependent methyltransferase